MILTGTVTDAEEEGTAMKKMIKHEVLKRFFSRPMQIFAIQRKPLCPLCNLFSEEVKCSFQNLWVSSFEPLIVCFYTHDST